VFDEFVKPSQEPYVAHMSQHLSR